MIAYALRRLGLAVAVLLVTVCALFCVIYAVPGDPATVALGPRATAEQKAIFRAEMGLDRPIYVQLGNFLSRVAGGDLGRDVVTDQRVSALVLSALPNTVALAFGGILWAVVVGVALGCWSGLHPNGWADRVIGVLSVSVIAVPTFVVAIYTLLFFAVMLQWFPAIGVGADGDPLDQLHHLVLPAFAVGLGWVGYLSRLVRASMLEVLAENHVRTFRAFGVSDLRIAFRYALPIAVVPVVSVLGVGLGSLLSGAVLTEIVFNRPGLGRLAYDAVISRNYPIVTGVVIVTASLYLICNLCADLLVARLSPHVRAAL
ncbi:ABC transporter permease [Zavarzinia sp.]|uniref:ABC transporter permease n=1 Tax=Zavarzinia sp. TaxID=2027920 RepID=UPI0035645E4E